ncbi:hypothetical protein BJ875DRAFT_63421 [Amylocarpus encephaloides]|uniref:Uncharacterized protein n=1 Tax=Amylocarpus encephaloides TaxID=45428 RepID=A0A9P7YRD2_9HELO|nr:hypothetical protein BJ875DRAFT_63421 [Amylocarpus encephaloides]
MTTPRPLHKDNMTCGPIDGFASPVNFGICAFPSWQVNSYARGVLETCCGGSDIIIPSADGCFFYCAIETTQDADEFKSCLNNIPSPEWQDYFEIRCSNVVGAALDGGSLSSSGESSANHPKTIMETTPNSSSSTVSSTVVPPSTSISDTSSIASTLTITSTFNGTSSAITATNSPKFVNSTLANSTMSIPSSILIDGSSTSTASGTVTPSITVAPPTDIPTAPPAAPTSSTSTSAAGHTSALSSFGIIALASLTLFGVLSV